MKKGFTLIELMIVIAIIAIIAAIAIPNLMASRIRANEATAISAIKQIATAQVTFQSGKNGRNTLNSTGGPSGFCTNYRNLAFGRAPLDPTGKLALITDAIGNAFIVADDLGPTTIANTNMLAGADGAAYQGYLFHNDPAVAVASPGTAPIGWYGTNYAVFARPATAGTTGNNEYWVGQQGTVFMKGVPITTAIGAPTAAQSPLTATTDWESM